MMTLPIIDISPYLTDFEWPPTPAQLDCSVAVHQAILSHGFFYLEGLGFSAPQLEKLLQLAKAFFDLPQDKKEPLSIASTSNGTDGARGWQRLKENTTGGKLDFHEGLDLYKSVEPDATLPVHGVNQWPAEQDVPGFNKVYTAYIDHCLTIGKALVTATGVGLSMDKDELDELLSLVDDSYWVMRCIGYPTLPETHDGVSCGAHKDYGCYTLLHCSEQPGSLQVYTKHGNWISADPLPGKFVVNIGEQWETWTNGLYKSTLHKVVHRGDSYRISSVASNMAYSIHLRSSSQDTLLLRANWDAEIRPLDAALRLQESEGLPTQPLKKSVVYGDFLSKKVAGNFSTNTGKKY